DSRQSQLKGGQRGVAPLGISIGGPFQLSAPPRLCAWAGRVSTERWWHTERFVPLKRRLLTP
ncbi:unnamed protein product, partial [marine sediment metagenome]